MTEHARPWSEPALVEGWRAVPIGPRPIDVVSLPGNWSACDLWVKGAAAAWLPAQLEVIGCSGDVEARLAVGSLQVGSPIVSGGWAMGIAASVRGRAVEAFKVRVVPNPVLVLPAAYFRLHAWAEGDGYGDAQAAAPIGLWGAEKWIYPSPAAGLAVGVNAIAPADALGRRLYIDAIELTTDDLVARQVDLLAGAVVVGRYVVLAGAPVLAPLAEPLWDLPAVAITAVLSGLSVGSVVHCNLRGFIR